MSDETPAVARTIEEIRARVAGWRAEGLTVALVPTMGALHAGHVSLVETARRHADRVVVSIFVNPTQFAPTEDFSAYPRTFEADLHTLAAVGAEAVYAPAVETMYPPGAATTVTVEGPATVGLEDASRPFHFAGVATIVAKLFAQVAPDVAVFGEKDFQQLAVIRRMAADLDLPVEVIGAPTLREADGLAMSSRNVYLSPDERAKAPTLHRILQEVAAALGADPAAALAKGHTAIAAAGFDVDYLELRAADDLGDPRPGVPWRLLVAARLGRTRLLDNIAV
jgi:pantoate--beta-alanine ligase